jgi:hypothetical protein
MKLPVAAPVSWTAAANVFLAGNEGSFDKVSGGTGSFIEEVPITGAGGGPDATGTSDPGAGRATDGAAEAIAAAGAGAAVAAFEAWSLSFAATGCAGAGVRLRGLE